MRKFILPFVAISLITWSIVAAEGADWVPATQPAAGSVALYEDVAANSSVNVQQYFPAGGAQTAAISSITYTAVRRITLTQDVFVIEWQNGAVTLLPKQFVASMTINKKR